MPDYRPFPSFAEWDVQAVPVDILERYAELLSQSKSAAGEDALKAAVEIATRSAAVDTGAIEGLYQVDRGFTYTVATQAAAWQAVADERGEGIRTAIEDALRGYEFVLDLATQAAPLSEAYIRELHQLLCASQETHRVLTDQGYQEQPLSKGQYKKYPNNPMRPDGTRHEYAPVIDVPVEMARLLTELRSDAFASASPVVQAAYAHYAFVCIHPFADGNGRVSRALASIFLYRSPGVPLVIFADQRGEYFACLEAADADNPAEFVAFLLQRTIDTIELVRLQMSGRRYPSAADSLAKLRASLEQASTPRSSPEVQAGVARLQALIADEFQRQLGALDLPPGATVQIGFSEGPPRAMPNGYRVSEGARNNVTGLNLESPFVHVFQSHSVLLAEPDFDGAQFLVVTRDRGQPLEIQLSEVDPVITELLKNKLRTWVGLRIDDLVASFGAAYEQGLRGLGRLG